MLELYLRNSDVCDFQSNSTEDLKNSVAEYFYYNDGASIAHIEQVSESTGDVLRKFSWQELTTFQLEVEDLVREKREADNDFLGVIEAAKEALSQANF